MAPETATVIADSSPSEVLASLTPEQKTKWRVSGELPEVESKEAPKKEEKTEAASSPAAKTETPASTSEKTENETTAAPATAKEEHKPKGAEARIKELLADNKRLTSELETARRAPVAAPAKIEEVAKPHRNDVDAKTGMPVYANDEAFEKAHEAYLTAKITADVEKRQAKANQDARVAEQNKIIEQRWLNALKISNEKHPDFAQVVDIGDEVKDGKTLKNVFRNKDLKTIKTNGVLDAWIVDSEIGAEMLYHFAKNPADIERIQNLGPFAAARELTKLEEKLSGTSAPPARKEEESAERSSPNVSKAPAPAASIAGKGTAPVDEEEAAVRSEDFRRYQRVANAEEAKKYKKAS